MIGLDRDCVGFRIVYSSVVGAISAGLFILVGVTMVTAGGAASTAAMGAVGIALGFLGLRLSLRYPIEVCSGHVVVRSTFRTHRVPLDRVLGAEVGHRSMLGRKMLIVRTLDGDLKPEALVANRPADARIVEAAAEAIDRAASNRQNGAAIS